MSNSINGGTPRERDFLTNSVSLTFGTYATPSAWQAENAFGGVIASEAAVGRMERTIQVQWHRHHRARLGLEIPDGAHIRRGFEDARQRLGRRKCQPTY